MERSPFALKISESTKVFLGHTVKRDDGYLLMMLDLTPADVLLKYFWQWPEEFRDRVAREVSGPDGVPSMPQNPFKVEIRLNFYSKLKGR